MILTNATTDETPVLIKAKARVLHYQAISHESQTIEGAALAREHLAVAAALDSPESLSNSSDHRSKAAQAHQQKSVQVVRTLLTRPFSVTVDPSVVGAFVIIAKRRRSSLDALAEDVVGYHDVFSFSSSHLANATLCLRVETILLPLRAATGLPRRSAKEAEALAA